MLSLWKLRVGVESYYLAQVASGLDEYYTGSGEAAGHWTGTGTSLLGLTDTVTGEDLRAVLAGLAPDTGLTPNGTRLVAHPRRVPGFDLTFSVPKSVSVVYALGDPLVEVAVTEACEAAVGEALSWLEREACFVRRGTNNRRLAVDPGEFGTRRMIADGFVAARFQHRTSRLGDPHLHWHVLVANIARGIDGRWTALDGTALYKAQRTVGVVFQATMRRELTERLGVEWGPMHADTAEIAGVPSRVLREFSQRTEQIAEWMDTHGVQGPAAKTEALLETRTSKPHLDDFTTLEATWRQRADHLGWGPAQLEALLATAPSPHPVDGGNRWVIRNPVGRDGTSTSAGRVVSFDEWLEWLLATRVTEKSGTFTRFDLTQAIAADLPATTPLTTIAATVNRALAHSAVVQVGDHWTQRHPVDAPDRTLPDDRELLYTSRALLAIEERLLAQLVAGVHAGVGVLDPGTTHLAIEASVLGDDQAHAIRRLTAGGDRVAVMVGRAGTGKTHTLGTLRQVYEAAGWEVIGLAPAARAARELHDGAGIVSTTIARHRVEQRTITATTLVVIDEAGMAGTRDITAIIDQATTTGAKVVLVGDHHQLPEIAAGGAFRAALDTVGDLAVELTVNRRQQHQWERGALDQLRNGDVPTAFAAYLDHGRVVIADTPDDLHKIVLGDWNTTRTTGTTLLLAGTRAEARRLNHHARHIRATNGELDLDHQLEIAGLSYAIGDHVVLGRNDPHQHLTTGEAFAVDNGMRGTITHLTVDQMTIHTTSGEHVVLDRDYLDHGWVDHAYAITIHKAQGVTCDHVLVVGPAGLYREGAYVALSRARNTAHLYATTTDIVEIEERHQHGLPLPTEHVPDPQTELLARLQHSAAKNLVIVDDPDAPRIAQLVDTVDAPELLRLARYAAAVERDCGLPNPAELRVNLDTATELRHRLYIGQRVRAVDRDNVGHVLTINDTGGTCSTRFESTDGRIAIKTVDWAHLVAIDHPDTVHLTPTAVTTLAQRTAAVAAAEHYWAQALATRGIQPGDATRYRRALHTATDQAARRLLGEPPESLTTWLGSRPSTPPAAAVWDDATTRIAHHRLLHNIPAEAPGIGPRPDEPAEAQRWQRLMLRILEDRLWLNQHHTLSPVPLTVSTPNELIDRQAELQQLVATAPADQRQFIDRIVHSNLDPAEIHDYLTAAMSVQDTRREWIIANWPHIVELEQVTRILRAQQPLAHWPEAQPDPVRHALVQLRQLAPDLNNREDRTLAELERKAIDNDPVRRLEQRRNYLQQIAIKTTSPAEADAVHEELNSVTADLRKARRVRTVDDAFDRYQPNPNDHARTTRLATLAADVLTAQPSWVIEHVRSLHDTGELPTTETVDLAARIIQAAAHRDVYGEPPVVSPPVLQTAELLPAPIEVG